MELLYLIVFVTLVFLFVFWNRDSIGNVNQDQVLDPKIERDAYSELRRTKKYAYLHPKYGALGWDGEGDQPSWIVDYLKEGGSLHDLES